MEKSSSYGQKTLEDYRKEVGATKTLLCKEIGVDPKTYNSWVEGESVPNLSRAVRLAKFLKKPIHTICLALGVDMEGVPDFTGDETHKTPSPDAIVTDSSGDYAAVARLVSGSPPEDVEALLRLLLNKNSDGSKPSPEMPS